MAGLNPLTAIAARAPARQPASDRLLGQNLVDASVLVGSRSFSTLIREGASTEELIHQVAKENGGGVARVYYPEFDTWEIVAVKIGDILLVKGDPKRVAEADFSDFKDPEGMRAIAVEAAKSSTGGIHFSVGESGIPMAVMQDRKIVFPNATELRVGSCTRNIALWTTEVNADPVTLADLNRQYSRQGGVAVSEDAFANIARSHGGMRSDKILLEDNLLILDKDTGDIMTAAQYSSSLPKGISRYAQKEPLPASPPLAPAEAPARQNAGPAGGISLHPSMMDASPARVPYIITRVFDGSVIDLFSVRYRPLKGEPPRPIPQTRIQPESQRSAAVPSLRFALLQFASDRKDGPDQPPSCEPAPARMPEKAIEKRQAATPPQPPRASLRSMAAKTMALLPEAISRSWISIRKKRLDLPVPRSVSRMDIRRNPLPPSKKKAPPAETELPSKGGRKKEDARKKSGENPKARAKPAALAAPKPKSRDRRPSAGGSAREPARSGRARPGRPALGKERMKAGETAVRASKANHRKTRQPAEIRIAPMKKTGAVPAIKPGIAVAHRKSRTPKATRADTAPRPLPVQGSGRRKKKPERRTLLTLIGLFGRKSRKKRVSGRASAGSSG